MQYAITFLEGVITFISPCLLPLLPVYVAFFAGGVEGRPQAVRAASTSARDSFHQSDVISTADGTGNSSAEGNSDSSARLRRTALSAMGFVIGFSLLFTLMGAFAGTVGSFFLQHQTALNVVCGVIVIVMGLSFMGFFQIPLLQRTFRLDVNQQRRGFWASLVFGLIFAIGWTPCVGAFLASALSLAASTGSTLQGVLLLACYSLGLGVPFFLAAILIDQLEGAFSWVKQHYTLINRVCGAILVVVGVLMATGQLGRWLAALSVF